MYDVQMSDTSEWKKLRKQLKDQGAVITGGGRRHFKIHWEGRLVSVMASTAGGGRALRNQKAELRRAGIKI